MRDHPSGWAPVAFCGDSRGFGTIARYLAWHQRTGMIGTARCHAVPAREVMACARDLIRRDLAALLPAHQPSDSRAGSAVRQRLAYVRATGPHASP